MFERKTLMAKKETEEMLRTYYQLLKILQRTAELNGSSSMAKEMKKKKKLISEELKLLRHQGDVNE